VPIEATADIVDAGFANTAGEPIIVHSAEDEALVLDMLGIKAPAPPPSTVSIPLAASRHTIAEEEHDREQITDLEAENARLRKQLAQSGKPAKRKYTRRAPKRLTLDEMAASETE